MLLAALASVWDINQTETPDSEVCAVKNCSHVRLQMRLQGRTTTKSFSPNVKAITRVGNLFLDCNRNGSSSQKAGASTALIHHRHHPHQSSLTLTCCRRLVSGRRLQTECRSCSRGFSKERPRFSSSFKTATGSNTDAVFSLHFKPVETKFVPVLLLLFLSPATYATIKTQAPTFLILLK